jgi:hypothetical protein
VVDKETYDLRGIDHAYQGLPFCEGKMALPQLGRFVHHFGSSPIFAPQIGNGMVGDQDHDRVESGNASQGKDIDIHRSSPFPSVVRASHFDTRERLGAVP